MTLATTSFDAKAFATLQARAALLGCTLIRTYNDRGYEVFVTTRGGHRIELDSAQAFDIWLHGLDGHRHG